MFTYGCILHRLNPLLGTKLAVNPSPFHVSTSSCLTLAGALLSDYVAACSTALRSAAEENE